MNHRNKILFGIVLIICSFSFGSLPAEVPSIQHTAIIYKHTADANLVLHIFTPAIDVNTSPLPGIVLFHGGGWTGGKPDQLFEYCKHFASRQMVAFSVEYRLIDGKGNTPFECVKDSKAAIRWVRAHASKLNIDKTKIVAGGASSGGHLALCTAFVNGLEEGEDLQLSSKPDALVLLCPVTDLSRTGQGPTGSFYTQLFEPGYIDLAKKGYTVEGWAAKLLEISPLRQVRKEQCPAIIIHGTADTTTPFETAKTFCSKMQSVGNTCEIVAFTGSGHGAFSFGEPKYFDAISAADDFLRRHAFINGK